MSQQELADLAQCSRVAVSNIERGVQKPGADIALRLAAALGTSVERLFGPLADKQARAELRVLSSDELAAALADNDHVAITEIPTAAFAASMGMGAAEHAQFQGRAVAVDRRGSRRAARTRLRAGRHDPPRSQPERRRDGRRRRGAAHSEEGHTMSATSADTGLRDRLRVVEREIADLRSQRRREGRRG